MSTKRVILAKGSRLLREILRRVIDKADHLEVVQEISDWDELPAALQRFDPEWVISQAPETTPLHPKLKYCMKRYPNVRFVFLSPKQNKIKMRWQLSKEAEHPDLSLQEFIRLLAKDLQRT